MDQISVNTPTKKPVNITNIETVINSTNTEALFNSIHTVTLVNSINPDPFKHPVPHKYNTWKNTVLNMELTKKVW